VSDREGNQPRAVVLLSGGVDSATALAIAVRDGYACHALSFRYGQRHAIEVEAAGRAPLINMSKAEIIRTGMRLGVDYSLTVSCYDPDAEGRACGHCDSCRLRRRGFHEAGVPDPTIYQETAREGGDR